MHFKVLILCAVIGIAVARPQYGHEHGGGGGFGQQHGGGGHGGGGGFGGGEGL